ncbi:DUF5977 domain-containing protein [Pseudoflavitalea rhizosphaerae]|uniref:DUF5977 domain-containing protein n=1 Tax=Pseudoflavitalea rhizosphaerae TaxID=1884793 RepID=UPI000F8CE3B9|nr:DUF5977 domain-containing protein [Pseudoflavitalea rhizosphaerae]
MNFIYRQLTPILLTLLCIFIFVNFTSGQNNGDFKEPSLPAAPNTAALLEYTQIPVSKYTGQPSIQIPLYTIKTGSLSLPVTLSYHASGIKVQQEASWVGLGWSLNAGGVISRSIRGVEDFGSQGVGYWAAPNLNSLFNGEWFNLAIGVTPTEHMLIKKIINREYDAEPDLFFLNIAGISGKFVFDKQVVQDGMITATLLDQTSNFRVQYNVNEKKFIVTDGKGVTYFLATPEYSYSESHNTPNLSHGATHIEDRPFDNYCMDDKLAVSWHLDKIISANNVDEINFSYDVPSAETCAGIVSTPSLSESMYTRKTYSHYGYSKHIPNLLKYSSVSRSLTQPVDLIGISFREGDLLFFTSSRQDLNTTEDYIAPKLDHIKIFEKRNPIEIRSVMFEYDYFNSTGTADNMRLQLKKLFIAESPYEFTYNETITIPSKRVKGVDFWGYYNNRNNDNLIPRATLTDQLDFIYAQGADRMVNKDAIQMGMLTSIKYPTGGTESFEFEPNDFNGVTPVFEDVPINVDAHLTYYSGVPSSPYNTESFYIPNETVITISGNAVFDGNCNGFPGLPLAEEYFAILVSIPSEDAYPDFTNIDQYYSGDILYKLEYGECENNELSPYRSTSMVIQPGWYRIVAYCHSPKQYSSVGVVFKSITGYDPGIKAGGLRVKRISTSDGSGTEMIRKFEYHLVSNPGISSGSLMSYPLHSFNTIIDYPTTINETFEILQSSSLNPLSTAAHGSFVGYDAVTEYLGENGENGKIVSTFLNGSFSGGPYIPPSDLNFIGRPLIETTYDADGNIVLKKENFYESYGPSEKLILATTATTYPFLSEYAGFDDPMPGTPFLYLPFLDEGLAISYYMDVYPVRIDWWRLSQTTTTTYTIAGNSVENVHYSYNPQVKQISSTTTEVGNNISKTVSVKYASDYSESAGDVYSKMISKNMLDYPVETQQWITRGGNTSLLSSSVIEYKSFYSDKFIMPYRNYRLNTSTPIPSTQAGAAVAPYAALLYDPEMFNLEHELQYDQNANVTVSKKVQSPGGSYIYSPQNNQLIASVMNDPLQRSWFDNFEEPNTFTNLYYDVLKANTGNYSGRISNTGAGKKSATASKWLEVSLTDATQFKFSGWIYSSGPSANIVLLMKRSNETGEFSYSENVSTTTTNKWVFVEKTVSIPADVVKMGFRLDNNSTGSVWFDDVRLHASGAEMTTYTHAPLIGVTSLTDVKNRITRYEYDRMGRLHLVRDHDNNILRVICYNFQGQPEDCKSNYFNVEQKRTFTVNNCAPGAVGGSIEYVVPANIYSSIISQADADQKALNEIFLLGQEHANMNGSCLFYNTERSESFTRNNCGTGTSGQAVMYTVPEKQYSSAVSQQDADQLAIDDIAANGQNYANSTGTCSFLNTMQFQVFSKTTCPANYKPGTWEYVVPAGMYSSLISQQDADQQALNEIAAQGQNAANTNANCTMVYVWLAHDLSDYYEDDYLITEEWSYWVEFYEDANKTLAMTVPFSFNINYTLDIGTPGGSSQTNGIYVTNPGLSTYLIGEMQVYYSSGSYFEHTTISLLPGSYYTIIP